VLWPDRATGDGIRAVWDELASHGLPSMATRTHRLHQPHVSLVVADDMAPAAALAAVGAVPRRPIPLLVEAAGVFPGGFLFLACVCSDPLLDEHRRVFEAVRPVAQGLRDHVEPGTWTPHLTIGWALSDRDLAQALPLVLARLPIRGWLAHGGVEDGTTGENWPSSTGPPDAGIEERAERVE
jgi:hypothetical protein